MKKQVFRVIVLVVLLFTMVAITACANETEALQAQINTLEAENAELQSSVSTLRADLERTQLTLSSTQSELQFYQSAYEAAQAEEQASQQDNQSGPLAITYGGAPNKDMSWPLSYGELVLGLRIIFDELDEDAEIVWRSTNEDVFTVISDEEGTSATVTPLSVGAAELVVTVGEQETRSWVRIT